MRDRESIKIVHAALDQTPGGEIILRGLIDPESLHLLSVDDYQREILPLARISELVKAFEVGSVPDIDLGMRGQSYSEREGAFYLKDPVYIVDGLQRVTAAKHLLQKGGDKKPRLGAAIHFDTNVPWERERFRILNADRTKLSPNVLARNLQHDYPAVEMLFNLSHDSGCVMGGRVSWNQRMQRSNLITAMTFLKVAGWLHGRFGAGRSHRLEELARGLNGIMENVGRNIMRDNMKIFFDVVDQTWGIRTVAFKEGASYIRTTFLLTLASVFSLHRNFWNDKRLTVERTIVQKLRLFQLTDPNIANLASAGGSAGQLLFQLMVNHINSGKRSRRLVPFQLADAVPDPMLQGVGEEENEEDKET